MSEQKVSNQHHTAGNIVCKENYRPFAERLTNQADTTEYQADNRLGFHGKAVDTDTGLQYFGARYYDPVLGRFMGVDPVGFQEDNIHSFNKYAYGNNNPYRFIDPDGNQSMSIHHNVWNRAFGNSASPRPDGATGFEVAKQGIVQGYFDGLKLSAEVGMTVGSLGLGGGAVAAVQETAKVGNLVATHGRTMSNSQLDKLIKSIRTDGVKQPLTVTQSEGRLYIVDGHHRALAAPRAGVAEVPINRVELPYGAYKSPADLTFTPGGY